MRCSIRSILVLALVLGGCQASLTSSGRDGGGGGRDGGAGGRDGGTSSGDAAFGSDGAPDDVSSDWVPGDGSLPEDPDAGDEDEVIPPPDIVEPPDPEVPLPPDEPDEMDTTTEPGATTIRATYRVLHWNIAGGKVNDCRTPAITAAVRRYVHEHDIDFVGLNEVCPDQFDAIRDALRAEWGLGAGATFAAYVGDGTPRIVGNAIFSRFPLEDITRHQVGEDVYGSRNLLCGHVASRPHLRFCSTHLTPGDVGARVQLGRVHDRIEQWWMDRRDTVILTGDLNLMPNDPGLDAVYSDHAAHPRNNPGNHGAYHELDDSDADHCMGFGERSTPGLTGGPCHAGGKIDFILVRQNRIHDGSDYTADTMNIPDTCGGLCSDHRAVRGRVRLLIRVD